MKKIIWIITIICLSMIVTATPISNKLHVSGYLINSTGNVEVDNSQLYTFKITTDDTCTTVIYAVNTTLSTDKNGVFSYYLPNINNNFTDQTYLCTYKNNILRETNEITPAPASFSAVNNPYGFITNTVNNLLNYYLKTNTYNKTEVYNKTETYNRTEIDAMTATIDGLDLYDLFSRKYYYRTASFESVTAGYNEPWVGATISVGTASLFASPSSEHPGVASLLSSTTASSGYSFQITGATTYLLGKDYKTSVSFMPFTKSGNGTQIKFGFMDVFTTGLPADAVMFNITQLDTVNFTIMGLSRNSNSQTNTTSTYIIRNNTWYAMHIYINNATLATFSLFNETILLWNDTVTRNIPTGAGRQTSHAFIAHVNGGTIAQILANLDYMNVGINRSLTR